MIKIKDVYEYVRDLIEDDGVCDIQLIDGTLLEHLTKIQNDLANFLAQNPEEK